MPPRKRAAPAQDDNLEAMKPVAKRRSSRQAAFTAAVEQAASRSVKASAMRAIKSRRGPGADDEEQVTEPTTSKKAKLKETKPKKTTKPTGKDVKKGTNTAKEEEEDDEPTDNKKTRDAVSPDPDTADIPIQNPDVARHEGKWYWLLKAEPETRLESGVDVRFSIDDLRARTKPEGWDGETHLTQLSVV